MGKNSPDRRKYFANPLIFMLLASLGLNFFLILRNKKPVQPTAKSSMQVKVSRIVDGDTFDSETGVRFRLYDIDAPEFAKGCMGEDAKQRLRNLIVDKNVQLETFANDIYGRTLAYVYLDKLFINEILTEEGFAYFFKGKQATFQTLILEQAQEKARLAQRGVWSSLCQTQQAGCVIKGNYRSADNTRIYHTEDCYNYDKITINPRTSDRWFCTEEEAITAGFLKSKDCPKN